MVTKENVYVNLQDKTKEELNEIVNFLESIKEKTEEYIRKEIHRQNTLEFYNGEWLTDRSAGNKQEVTIEQLKEILQPMGKFTPIAMRCTQEQFDAIKPKLKECVICFIDSFSHNKYLVNNAGDAENVVTNVSEMAKSQFNRTVYEEWNEELFLKACGIEDDTLKQQLEKAKAEVERLEKLINAKEELKRIQNLIDSLENERNS